MELEPLRIRRQMQQLPARRAMEIPPRAVSHSNPTRGALVGRINNRNNRFEQFFRHLPARRYAPRAAICATSSAMAREAVRPGDSIPNKLMIPATP